MLPVSEDEIARIRRECRKMVTKRAALSGGASMVPIPGVDIAADVGLLFELLPEINKRFGLSPDQIEEYNPQMKMFVANAIINMGTRAAGKWITKELVMMLLKRVGVRITAKQAAKYVPFIGQGVAAALGFTAMKIVGNQHIEECSRIARHAVAETKRLPPPLP